jgi:hypothetical protein
VIDLLLILSLYFLRPVFDLHMIQVHLFLNLQVEIVPHHLILVAEDGRHFFEGQPFGIREEDPDSDAGENPRDDETKVKFPANSFKCNGRAVRGQ